MGTSSLISQLSRTTFSSILFWVSFPFLIPQALWVRRTAPRFAPASGPDRGVVGEGEVMRVVGIGDSIIAGVGAGTLSRALIGQAAEALAESRARRVSWHALGRSGAATREIVDCLKDLQEHPVDIVIISAGVNDVTGLGRPGRWLRNVHALLVAIQNHSPDAAVVFLGLPPLGSFPALPQPLRALLGMRARQFDAHLVRYLDKTGFATHLPIGDRLDASQFSGDGFHPSEESYGVLGRAIAEHIR